MLKPVQQIMGEMADRLESTAMVDESAPKPEADEMPDWHAHTLRKYSPELIQKAFEKALYDLTGKEFSAHIPRINFEPKWAGGYSLDYADILLRLSPKR